MARVKSGIAKMLSGKLGNYVFRQMNGETFVSIRPSKYKVSKSEKAKNGRSNFASAVNLSSAVNSISELKKIWLKTRGRKSSPYHKILKKNLLFVKDGRLTLKNIITPEGQSIDLFTAKRTTKNIILNFSIEPGILGLPVYVVVIVADSRKFLFSKVILQKQSEDGSNYKVRISLNDYENKLLKSHGEKFVFCAIIEAEESKKSRKWSSTVSAVI